MSESVAWPDLDLRVPAASKAVQQALEDARRQGHAEGMELGRKDGLAAAVADLAVMRERFEASMRAFAEGQRLDTQKLNTSVTDLARRICYRILCVELRTNAEAFASIVERGLKLVVPAGDPVEVRVNPEDYTFLADSCEQEVKLMSDADVDIGGVLLRSSEGMVEFDFQTALEEIFDPETHATQNEPQRS